MFVCVVLNVQLPLNKWLLCSFDRWLGRARTHTHLFLTPINLACGNIIPNNLYSLQKYSKCHTMNRMESHRKEFAHKLKSHMQQPQTHQSKWLTKLNESTFAIIAFARRYSSQMLLLSNALSLSIPTSTRSMARSLARPTSLAAKNVNAREYCYRTSRSSANWCTLLYSCGKCMQFTISF